MRKYVIGLIALIFPFATLASENPDAALLLYTGNILGQIEPVQG